MQDMTRRTVSLPPNMEAALIELRKTDKFMRRKIATKSDYILPAILGIKSMIGDANTSRCWWKFALGRSESEWFSWYLSKEK